MSVNENGKKSVGAIVFALITFALAVVSWQWGKSLVSLVAVFTSVMAFFSALFTGVFYLLKQKVEGASATASGDDNSFFDHQPGREERALLSFQKVLVPLATILISTLLLASAFYMWNNPEIALQNELQTAAITLLPIIMTLLVGSYFSGISRESGLRWLRASSGWLIATSAVLSLSLASYLLSYFFDFSTSLDLWLSRVVWSFIGVIALEQLVGVIFTFYRMENAEDEQPTYESRLLTVIFQPGGVAKNIAELVDYQFGLKVSDHWFLATFEKIILPLAFLILTVMWLMSSVVLIPVDSQGILERFGQVTSKQALTAGLHFKLPYPFSEVKLFPSGRVQEFSLGHEVKDNEVKPEVLLWTKSHVAYETHYLLPEGNSGAKGDGAAISLLSVEIPVRYLVKDVYKYLYHFKDAKQVLKQVAQAEIVSYLAQTEFFNFLGVDRFKGASDLQKRIQKRADLLDMGIEVVYVSFISVHPPVAVGLDFQEVVSSLEKKSAMIQNAYAYEADILPRTEGNAFRLVALAESYRDHKIKVAKAEEIRFIEQLKVFENAPSYVTLSEEMKVIEGTKGRRKYIVPTAIKHKVISIDLQDKLTPDLLDLDVNLEK